MTRTRTSNGNSWSLMMYKNLLHRTWQPGSRHSKVLFACAWHECDADVDDFCRGNAAESFYTKSARYVLSMLVYDVKYCAPSACNGSQ